LLLLLLLLLLVEVGLSCQVLLLCVVQLAACSHAPFKTFSLLLLIEAGPLLLHRCCDPFDNTRALLGCSDHTIKAGPGLGCRGHTLKAGPLLLEHATVKA
jgi:hypothetical protein